MNRPIRAMQLLVAGLTALLTSMPAASTHPHIFAEASLEVVMDEDRQFAALRHVWRFDEFFSSTVLLEFDANRDLKVEMDELETISSVIHQSLAEFDYFQFVTVDGKDIDMRAPERLIADFQDQQLIVAFESKPTVPTTISDKASFSVYDPTFYTAIDFRDDEHLKVSDLPAPCNRTVVRPDPDEILTQNQDTLTGAFFDDPSGNDLSRIFATRIELTCDMEGNG